MASSNKHWPSMFKSKPCNSPHHQWQHGINSSLNSSISCNRFPHAPGYVCEERTPDPKPRWNPRPEQIRILETIFNSGMVNPPRDEIRKIRVQLQEYGQVGDANVFYWFQNRKSRSKHRQKQRQLRTTKAQLQPATASNVASAPSPSSSSSDKSSANNSAEKSLSLGPTTVINLLNSPIASVNQTFFHAYSDVMAVPFLFPVQQNIGGSSSSNLTQDFCFPLEGDQNPSFLFSELKLMSSCLSKKDGEEKKNHQQQFRYTGSPPSHTIAPPPYPLASPATDQLLQECGGTKSTVFINDVCMEVGIGPFNVRQVFGDEAVLIESSGQAVVTDERGVTLQPLRHGAFYYLLLPFMAKPPFIW